MGSANTKRRLAAILAADVVGYSRLMEKDEVGTLRELKKYLAIFQRLIPEYDGRIFGGAGDSVIAEFSSTVQAVTCAIEIQNAIAQGNTQTDASLLIQFRIGISLGDVIVDGDNLMGHGVNVAARLESLAEPGGINISNDVYRQVHGKVAANYKDIGLQNLKNIPQPVRVYRVTTGISETQSMTPLGRTTGHKQRNRRITSAIALLVIVGSLYAIINIWQQQSPPNVPPGQQEPRLPATTSKLPGIAVLPFSNMSDDVTQDYFSDGMADDLITDLTKISGLFVIARDSTFYYKGETYDVRKVANDLGVRYVLHGSVRRANDQVRVNVQLTDASSGRQIWAERYDGDMTNVFGLQDEITEQVVTALAIKLNNTERERLTRRQTDNLEAYEYFLRGQELVARRSRNNNRAAQELLGKAIELDPEFAMAYALLGWSHVFDAMNGWAAVRKDSLTRAKSLASKALDLQEDIPLAYFVTGLVHREQGDYTKALFEAQKAIDLDPNYANGHVLLATLLYYTGRPEEGMERIKLAMRLNPHHPHNYPFHLGQAYFILKRYDEAIEVFKKGLEMNQSSERMHVWLAATYAQAGRIPDAEWEISQVKESNPSFSLSRISEAFPFKNPADSDHFLEGLRKAGLSAHIPPALTATNTTSDKTSLVVLPFTNSNNDKSQEYFSDGITADLINDLSRYSGLNVIARRSAYVYKQRQTNIQTIARELGVNYVLDGDVRRDGNTIRMNVQLIDAKSGVNIWAQRFDRETEDIFAVQDDIRKNIINTLSITLTKEEQSRTKQSPSTSSFAAYDLFLQGQASLVTRASAKDSRVAQQLMEQAIQLDPHFARAYAALALIHADAYRFDWTDDPENTRQQALKIGKRAIELDDHSPQAYWILGYIYLFLYEDHDKAIAMGKRATELAPNDMDAANVLAVTYAFGDEPAKAKLIVTDIMQHNQHYSALVPSVLGLANLCLGKYAESLAAYDKSLLINPSRIQGNTYRAVVLSRMGNIDDAEFQIDQLYTLHPDFNVQVWAERQPFKDKSIVKDLVNDLIRAGVRAE
jgi:adenylate cyclase